MSKSHVTHDWSHVTCHSHRAHDARAQQPIPKNCLQFVSGFKTKRYNFAVRERCAVGGFGSDDGGAHLAAHKMGGEQNTGKNDV